MTPRRGEVWMTDTGKRVLVISSTVYTEIADSPGLSRTGRRRIRLLRRPGRGGMGSGRASGFTPKTKLIKFLRTADTKTLTDVNNMLFRILATPDN